MIEATGSPHIIQVYSRIFFDQWFRLLIDRTETAPSTASNPRAVPVDAMTTSWTNVPREVSTGGIEPALCTHRTDGRDRARDTDDPKQQLRGLPRVHTVLR
jgi:hypothetical protein